MGRRNGTAQAALGRRAPTMKHRNAPRGGQRNEQAELLEEAEEEFPEAGKQFDRVLDVKRVFSECPLGWLGQKLITLNSTSDMDIIRWLQAMGDVVGKL